MFFFPLLLFSCLLIWLFFSSRALAVEASSSMPFGGEFALEDAAAIASAHAVQILSQEASREFTAMPVAAFASNIAGSPQAWAFAALGMYVCDQKIDTGTRPNRVTVTWCTGVEDAPAIAMTEWVQAEMRQPERLAWYGLVHERRILLLNEALLLGADVSAYLTRRPEDASPPQSPRLRQLARSLTALDLFTACLPLYEENGDGNGAWADPQAVIQAMQRAVLLDEHISLFWETLGDAYRQINRTQLALEALDRAVVLDPQSAKARYLRALVHLAPRTISLAEQDLDAAIRLAPDRAAYFEVRGGSINAPRGDYEAMCRDFRAACLLGVCRALESARMVGYCADEGR